MTARLGSETAMAGKRFLKDEVGVVAVLFGLLLIPMLGMAAAADYSRASNAKTQLQSALDATALAAARAAPDMDDEQLFAFAKEFLVANYANSFYYAYQLTSVTRDGNSVILTGSGNVPTSVFGVMGVDNVSIGAVTQANWRVGKVEIALVLDNTGSMSKQNRMVKLKEATHGLLEILRNQGKETDDVRIAIVPFDMHVRVPTSYATADWLKPIEEQGPGQQGQGHAHGHGQNSADWEGCIEDRNHPYDVDARPASSQQRLYPAVECNSDSLATILPLTSNFDTLGAKVNQLTPAGWTNITIGMVWGLNTLTPHEPYTEAAEFGTEDVTKIMIVMTDGMNTRNRWNSASAQIDVRTRMACDSVKDTGVMLYTVRFMEGDQALLRNCATRPDMFYDVERLDQLKPAFEAIAAQISQIRLTR
jgi:Flp pilus assembly protein TadG